MGQAATKIDSLQASLSASQAKEAELARETAALTAAGVKERAEAAAKLQAQFDDMTARIQAAEDESRNKVALEQAKALNGWGAGLTGAAMLTLALCAVFGGIVALRAVGPFAAVVGLCGLACFGLAQVVSQWWFKWAVLGVVALVGAVIAWWVIKKYRASVLGEAASKKAAQLKSALTEIVPVLDDAYDNADAAGAKFMDEMIFAKLSKERMDESDKAVVHEIRNDIKRAA
jgi:hypothetical protein